MGSALRIGLIGAGPWARMVTGPLLSAGPQTAVTGVWSRTEKHARALADQIGVDAVPDVDALFDRCDAVAIAVAPHAQPDLAVRAAEAGKTLLLEKPLADDVPGAERIVKAVDGAGAGALVMLSNRFNPAFADFLERVSATEPLGGRGCFVSGAFLGGPFAYGWRLERGAVLDVGPHLIDLLDAALGEIVDIVAAGDPLGTVSLVCTHASGLTSTGTICCSAATDSRTDVEVFGRAGTAIYDGRSIDFAALANRLRDDLVAVARGEPHPAGAHRGLHLQRLIARVEEQL